MSTMKRKATTAGNSTGSTGNKTPPSRGARATSPRGAGRHKSTTAPGTASGGTRSKNRKGFVPVKGGDGGVAVKARRGPNWNANALLVLTGASIRCAADRAAFELLLVETTDPCDRAHNIKKLISPRMNPRLESSFVLCGLGEIDLPGAAPVSRARRYHPSQVVGRPGKRVGFDSMFDGAAESARRLEDAGIEMGWHTTRVGECSRNEQALRHLFEGVDHHAVRDRIEQRTSQAMITREDIGD